eukprot:90491-Lingulodinium_polyedra.AAC.1
MPCVCGTDCRHCARGARRWPWAALRVASRRLPRACSEAAQLHHSHRGVERVARTCVSLP